VRGGCGATLVELLSALPSRRCQCDQRNDNDYRDGDDNDGSG